MDNTNIELNKKIQLDSKQLIVLQYWKNYHGFFIFHEFCCNFFSYMNIVLVMNQELMN